MDRTVHLLLLHLLLLHSLILISPAADPPITLPSAACSDELVAFSTCLPYVAVSPNNRTASPPPQCCEDISAAFRDGSAICLCYFVLRPEILGFPLDSTKLLSLTSVCPRKDQNSKADSSLETLCSGSAVLPPLRSISSPSNSTPHHSTHSSPPPVTGAAQESSGSELPSPPSLSATPTKRTNFFLWNLLSFPCYILTLYH